ncbi:MAG: hypothetical protein ACNA7W_07810, partial [Pseudomonadales bacterium]
MSAVPDVEAMAAGLLAAQRANVPYLAPSREAALDLAEAYAVQRAFTALRARTEPLAGFKAAANAAALQRALGLAGPVTGVLFASGERAAGSVVQRGDYRSLMIETEVGFHAARPIDRPVSGVGELQQAVSTCCAVIELADPGFGGAAIRGTDLVATNAATAGFIRGPAHRAQGLPVNALTVCLQRDGDPLHEVRADVLMGDQWQALLWLVNAVIEQGHVIAPGQLLITGALGGAHTA